MIHYFEAFFKMFQDKIRKYFPYFAVTAFTDKNIAYFLGFWLTSVDFCVTMVAAGGMLWA